MHPKKGLLISVEGIDGSGKSTLAHNLLARLIGLRIPTILTKEPGATPMGKQLRAMLQTQDAPICPQAQFLLFAADRAQHMRDVIKPALAAGVVVISDRMYDSSFVYQGYAGGVDTHMITKVNRWAMDGIEPDITFYVAIDAATAQQRLALRNEKLTAFEQKELSFVQKLIDGFEHLCQEHTRIVRLDGAGTPETVTNQAQEVTLTWIEKNNQSPPSPDLFTSHQHNCG